MPTEPTTDPKFEIGHVLFIDIVGYSTLLINEQSKLFRELNDRMVHELFIKVEPRLDSSS